MTRPDWCDEKTWDDSFDLLYGKKWWEGLDQERVARFLLSAKEEARKEERERIQALLARDAPFSPRRYIYDPTPDRRITAADRLDAAIRNGDAS